MQASQGLVLAQASPKNKLNDYFLSWGFQNSRNVTFLFFYSKAGDVLFLLVYIVDILITSSSEPLISRVISDLNAAFALKSLGSLGSSSHFLGFKSSRDYNGLKLTEPKYAYDLINKANLLDSKPCPTPMISSIPLVATYGSPPCESPSLYRSLVGGLPYLMLTRPNLAFAANMLS